MSQNLRRIKIMVSCGSGVATSMHVATKLKEYLEAKGLAVTVDGCSVNELPDRCGRYDLVVSSAQVPFQLSIPVFNAIPILTGIGEEQLMMKIEAKIREISSNIE